MSDPTPSLSAGATVARAGAIMAGAILLSRILGMVRDTVMFAQFGIGLDADAFRIAVLLPDIIFMLVAGGALSSSFIPVFGDYWHKGRREDAWKVFNSVLTITALTTTVLVGIAWLLAPPIVDLLRANKPEAVIPGAVHMSRILLPAQIAFLIGSTMIATLYVRKRFLAPSLAPNVYNVGIILGAAFLPRAMGMGIESMAWGALIGAVIGNVVIPGILMAREGSSFRPSLDTSHEGVRKFFLLLLPVVLGFSLPAVSGFITQYFGSTYGSDGINAVLGAANNLMQAPLGIFGQSMALAAFPVLTQFVATGRLDLYKDQVEKTIRTVLYLGVPSGALMFAFAPQIVHVLYGYGQAMDSPQRLAELADCLRIYSFGIFAWCVQPVLMRGFFSMQKTFRPVAIGTVMTGVFIILCWSALRVWPEDYRMLAWASNVAAVMLAIALFLALEGEVGRFDRASVLKSLGGCMLAAVIAAAFGLGGMALWQPTRRFGELVALATLGLASAWVYYAITKVLKMSETRYIDRAMKKRSQPSQAPESEANSQ